MIGLGTDLVEIPRFRSVLDRRPLIRDRLFTPAERSYAESLSDPVPAFAARFAAKEAVMKVLGVGLGKVTFHDIEVTRADSGAPGIELSGSAAEMSSERGISQWLVSMTHTDRIAQAVAAAV